MKVLPPSVFSLALPLVLMLPACGGSISASTGPGSKTPVASTEIVHEPCDLNSSSTERVDVNNDGRPDLWSVTKKGKEVCRAVDLNFDGRVDDYKYFDGQGQLRRRELDFDKDGVIDQITTYSGGKVVRRERETNLDGKLDTWDTYTNEVLTKRERDDNADGRVDQWWRFPDPSRLDCPVIEIDTDADGKPDVTSDVCKEREELYGAAAAPASASANAASTSAVAAPGVPADAGAAAVATDAGVKK